MKRYQVYLNSNSVDVIDDLEDETNIKRSIIIRMAVDTLAKNISLLRTGLVEMAGDLDEVVGIIKTKTKITNSSEKVNDVYYNK